MEWVGYRLFKNRVFIHYGLIVNHILFIKLHHILHVKEKFFRVFILSCKIFPIDFIVNREVERMSLLY